jgi:hypothetical protein
MEGKITRVHWRVAVVAGRVVQGACMGEEVEEGEKEGGIVTPCPPYGHLLPCNKMQSYWIIMSSLKVQEAER